MNSEAVVVPSLGTTIGATYVGAMLSSLLFGITVLQVFIYYRDYPNDCRLYRYSVGIIWVLDALHLSLIIHVIYHYTVDSFGDYVALENVVWSFKVPNSHLRDVLLADFDPRLFPQASKSNQPCTQYDCGSSGTISIGSFLGLSYSWSHADLWAYTPNNMLRGAPSGHLQNVQSHAVAARYTITTFTDLASMDWAIDASFATSTGIDFFISFATCYYLHKSRACSTIALVTGQVSWSIQYIALPNTLVFLGVDFLLAKLYVNSLLSMLNARKRIQGTNTGSGAALSEPTSFSNVIHLTPTAGGASAGDVKDGFSIPPSEIHGSVPTQNNTDSAHVVEDKRSRVEFAMA
ncbi:uncharacterized protein EV420DRAFT_1748671 [Desarmillaria tabescens]|uniref:DUF6534 domain-containing protein n=1 Tax=Armillaria tabescens TaxID=1929756 RepID=A0AA39KAE0_ARMTA|nr:uncharacterized protein EV420DRAFT_1748671 [Desarmillaria tabescens]KAK0457529.1 hypothetical protein EV420DRAFT_1748671 [Desarmillaria tabescens]